MNEQGIPLELQRRRQWIVWRFLFGEHGAKPRKVLYTAATNEIASATDSATWGTWEDAQAAYRRGGWEGVGYVFSATDTVAGVDLDNCVDAETGAMEPWAQAIIETFHSYTERSPSGRGAHILIHAAMPGGKGRRHGHYEAYSEARFFTITGEHLEGTPASIEERQEELDGFLATHLPARETPKGERLRQLTGNTCDDAALLERARAARNGAKVDALLRGDMGGYASQSDADLALCAHLAWWTNGDAERMDRLFRQSGLMREKWNERRGQQTYGERTIGYILDGFTGGYTGASSARLTHDVAGGADGGAEDVTTVKSPADRPKVERGPSIADQLVALASDALLFHDAAQTMWATIPAGTRQENWPLHSRNFKRWLARRLYERGGKTPGAQAIQDALNVLDGKAAFDGPTLPVYVRLAEHDGAIYLDLADEEWRAVRIDTSGWRLVSGAALPVKFRRPRGMLPLPAPVPNGALDELRRFVNTGSEDDWRLVVAWILSTLRRSGPFPILALNGEMGSAKTTLARVLRALIDPNAAPVRAEPKELRDLAIAANNSWAIVLDNLSSMPVWLSDGLCRLSTGGGSAYRTLYENDEETIFDAQRPSILTGIEEVATRGDLVDRAILVMLPMIPDAKRRPESAFWHDFEQARPAILGALLDAVVGALTALPQTALKTLPRMADFALWVAAAESTLGWNRESFLESYTANRRGANTLALEISPVAERLMALMEHRRTWDGTPTQLYDALSPDMGDGKPLATGWPKTPKGLSGTLKRLAPNLRRIGLAVTHYRAADAKGTRKISITEESVGENASGASETSDAQENPGNRGAQGAIFSDASECADTSLTHPRLHAMPDGTPILTHSDAYDAQSARSSHFAWRCPIPEHAGLELAEQVDGKPPRCPLHDCDREAVMAPIGAAS